MGYGLIVKGKQTPITPWKGSWAEQEERKRARKPYFEQIELAKRWDKCVDAGSPITAQRR